MPPPRLAIELSLLGLLACLWGSSYLFIRIALEDLPPATLMAVRVVLAAAFLLGVMHLRHERLPRDVPSWRLLGIQALLNSIAPWLLLAWGQQYIASGLAGVLNSTAPLFVALLALGTREATGARKVVGTLFGFAGVVMVVGPAALLGLGREVAAQLAVLAGSLLYALAALHGRHLAKLTEMASAAGTMLWAALALVPLSLAIDRPWTLAPSATAIAAAVALALLCTGVALVVYFRLVRTLGALGVASQAYLRAGISVLLGVFVLGESLAPLAAAGLAVIIVGVAAINAPVRKPDLS
jgi:drug/metabolite transporter (DMT)-like permease